MTPTTLQARKQQLVRDAIWEAALHLFEEKGFDETTVEDIAGRAGVSRRSFFRYFASKADLMAQGVDGYGDDLAALIDACPRGLALEEVFRHTVLHAARGAVEHPRTRRIMAIAARHPAARAAQLSRMPEVQDQVAAAYARRRPSRGGQTLASGILAGLTLSVLSIVFRAWFEQGKPNIEPLANQVLDTLNKVIRPRP